MSKLKKEPIVNITLTRFYLLSVVTYGLYPVFWFYKVLKYLKLKNKLDISPFWRAFFYPFNLHPISNKLNEELLKNEQNTIFNTTLITKITFSYFFIYIIFTITDKVYEIGSLLSILLTPLTLFPIIRRTNQLKINTNIHTFKDFKWWQKFIISGILLWFSFLLIVILIILFSPELLN